MTKIYPYFNEDAETNWKEGNSNMKMSHNMERIIRQYKFEVSKIDEYKVQDMSFKKQVGTSLPLVDDSQLSSTKDE